MANGSLSPAFCRGRRSTPLNGSWWATPTNWPTPPPWAVAEHPAENYNPLFIHGESGLGKTHLLYAIAHTIHKNHPDYKIVYIRGEDFTNELIRDIRAGKNQEFRDKYRSADVFLMDDVQFIAGRDSTQEEMFHTFNTLYEDKKQIVFTADRPPQGDAPAGGPVKNPV